jgi:hypothetical protein
MKQIYNFCNPTKGCRCPVVNILTEEEKTTWIKLYPKKLKIGRFIFLFSKKKILLKAMLLLIKVAFITDFFEKSPYHAILQIFDFENPQIMIIFKK